MEELADGRLGVGERDETVAEVARSWDAEFLAQATGRAAVVGDGHDRGDALLALLEAAQQRREARAAADGDDVEIGTRRPEPMLGDDFGNALTARRGGHQRPDHGVAQLIEREGEEAAARDEQEDFAIRVTDELEGGDANDVGGWAGKVEVAVGPGEAHRQGKA